ncbi:hypothetical protein TNCV_94731 [Trichonephila clavipes]|nr:hypothetical protein TNCV_94731 [Trichonephila clavipes]
MVQSENSEVLLASYPSLPSELICDHFTTGQCTRSMKHSRLLLAYQIALLPRLACFPDAPSNEHVWSTTDPGYPIH